MKVFVALNLLLCTFVVEGQVCVPNTSPICRELYNMTQMPNYLNQNNQVSADLELNQYLPLIKIQCDLGLRHFLCSIYFPECNAGSDGDAHMAPKPCFTECIRIYENCGPLLRRFGFSWPSSLRCDKFPLQGRCKVSSSDYCLTKSSHYNPGACIEYTKALARDNSSFWFGEQYKVQCPNGSATGWWCLNQRQNHTDSIESRFDGAIDISHLSTALNITYTSVEGTYGGCGSTARQRFNYTFWPSPATDTVNYPAYDTHVRPSVQWNAGHDKLYTLIIYDITIFFNHAVFTNIRGGDLDSYEEAVAFYPPSPPNPHPSVHVFLLFEHTKRIRATMIEAVRKLPRTDLPKTIISTLGLTNLVGMSWVNIRRDLYAAGKLIKGRIANICPDLLSKELERHFRPFLPKDIRLTLSANIAYHPTSIQYQSCCSSYNSSDHVVYPGPIFNKSVDTADVRSEVVPDVHFIPGGLFPSNTDGVYTLFMVDPDVPHASVGTGQRPLVHWMVINIPQNNVQGGQTIIPYRGPAPPPPTSHYHAYYFLVYEQSRWLTETRIKEFAGQNCTVPGRCLFDLKRFSEDENSKIVGANWMRAHNDPYIRHLYVDERGRDADAVCTGVKEYRSGCLGAPPSIAPVIVG